MNTKAARFSPEVRERTVRLAQECQVDYASLWGVCELIAPKIGCSVSTLHVWVQRKEIDAGQRPRLTTDERERLKQLSERTRSCAVPMTSSRLRALLCVGGTGPSHQELIDFVDRYRDAYGVEPICRLMQIAPSGYKRSQSDDERCFHIQRVWHANWQVYGAVKIWKQMHREDLCPLPAAQCNA